MNKIDRSSDGLALNILGTPVTLDSPDDEVMRDLLMPMKVLHSEPVNGKTETIVLRNQRLRSGCNYLITYQDREIEVPLDADWPRLDDLLFLLIAKRRSDLLMPHASCVSDGTHTLLFVGGSMHGKTTLALAFQSKGWRLMADDIAPLALDGEVHPFLTTPTLRPHTTRLLQAWTDSNGRLPTAAAVPARVTHIYFLKPPRSRVLPDLAVPAAKRHWQSMYYLLYGEAPPLEMLRSSQRPQHDERDFIGAPCFQPLSSRLAAARELLRFAYPSQRRFEESIFLVMTLLDRCQCSYLQPGEIDLTVPAIYGHLNPEGV